MPLISVNIRLSLPYHINMNALSKLLKQMLKNLYQYLIINFFFLSFFHLCRMKCIRISDLFIFINLFCTKYAQSLTKHEKHCYMFIKTDMHIFGNLKFFFYLQYFDWHGMSFQKNHLQTVLCQSKQKKIF